MILQIGKTLFDNCTVEPRISKTALYDSKEDIWALRTRWDLMIWLMNPTADQAKLKTKIEQLEACFDQDNPDVKLLQPDGKTPSAHVILARNSFGGVVLTKPSYPDGTGAQHVTFRTATAAVETTERVDSGSTMTEFVEEVTFQGGGPRFGHLEPLIGVPIKQTLKQNTIYRATQTGRAVGIVGFPNVFVVAPPIWQQALVESPIVVRTGPGRIGNRFTKFQVSWTYQYESAFPLFGNPNPWVF